VVEQANELRHLTDPATCVDNVPFACQNEWVTAVIEGPPTYWRHPDGLATLAAFWPPKGAQRCRLLRTSEHCFGSSAAEWAGSRRA
jgi:hypothetical protein